MFYLAVKIGNVTQIIGKYVACVVLLDTQQSDISRSISMSLIVLLKRALANACWVLAGGVLSRKIDDIETWDRITKSNQKHS